MQRDLLFERIKMTLQKTEVEKLASLVSEETFSVKDLIDLTFNQDQQIGFRAAWILENVYCLHREQFLPYAAYFLLKFPAQNNLSARRHYGKILALMTMKNAPAEIKKIISSYDTENLVDTVFSWLIDEHIQVAIKSHCLNILANLTLKHSWIKEELIQTIDFLVDKESIAFYAKVKQIRKQLK